MSKAIDLTGQRFGKLQVRRIASEKLYGQRTFVCLCDCGTEKLICGGSLRRGAAKSCGCGAIRYGNQDARKHGLYKHRLAGTWRSMKERCQNPNHDAYSRYGGRGIAVCERWLSLEAFVADNAAEAKPGTTIDRIDNDGDYEPSNCRWVTQAVQARNRTNNRPLTLDGRTQCLAAWAEETGINETTIGERLKRGWPVARALQQPV